MIHLRNTVTIAVGSLLGIGVAIGYLLLFGNTDKYVPFLSEIHFVLLCPPLILRIFFFEAKAFHYTLTDGVLDATFIICYYAFVGTLVGVGWRRLAGRKRLIAALSLVIGLVIFHWWSIVQLRYAFDKALQYIEW